VEEHVVGDADREGLDALRHGERHGHEAGQEAERLRPAHGLPGEVERGGGQQVEHAGRYRS